MMNGTKISRSQIKMIVKECLIEILQEGLRNDLSINSVPQQILNHRGYESSVVESANRKNTLARPRSSVLDTPLTKKPNSNVSSMIAERIRQESKGDPILADILADTAMTTLPKMLSSGENMNSSVSHSSRMTQVEHFQGTPEEVFGDDIASKWANLAFMDAPSKKIL